MVLVDTAGRMQDNAPLMTALAKLIAVNMPDLVLFVGEALVGNEAVDQLVSPLTYLCLLVGHILHVEGLTDSDEKVSVLLRLHGKSFSRNSSYFFNDSRLWKHLCQHILLSAASYSQKYDG